ncbi:hypothetical protein A2U01_0047324 [Trifolium medium]|uniref:Uncharacterized protein n=1 Tax=Trifolium medium TaxID=97028 RepID=A0A392QR71_9FABA|nr:hypothetical protein [Trifolium medium]
MRAAAGDWITIPTNLEIQLNGSEDAKVKVNKSESDGEGSESKAIY